VLGTRTANELGVEVGDQVSLASVRFAQDGATVVGTALLPAVGAFVADRSGLGRGAFVPVPRDPENTPSFVAIRLRHGADVDQFIDDIETEVRGWDQTDQAPLLLRTVRPPEIVNIREMRGAPLLLAAVLAASLAFGLAVAISVSVRERQRDLAILSALGLGSRALSATVHWQAVATTIVGLVAGVPIGIGLGRLAWGQFAHALGLVPRADVPAGWLLVVAAGGLVLALVAAYRPARSVARLSSTGALRAQ
jgi:ABC-type lipoprotein release transport system permease subunit